MDIDQLLESKSHNKLIDIIKKLSTKYNNLENEVSELKKENKRLIVSNAEADDLIKKLDLKLASVRDENRKTQNQDFRN